MHRYEYNDNAHLDMGAQRRFWLNSAFARSDQNLHWAQFWIAKDAKFLHADNEEADLSLRMAYISECIFSYVAADRVMGIANGV